MDDAVQTAHPAFAGNYSAALSYDFVSGIPDPNGNFNNGVLKSDGTPAKDDHGTAVAGVAVGNTTWGGPIGVAPGATLQALRINIGGSPVPNSPNVGNTPSHLQTVLAAFAKETTTTDVSNNSYGPDAGLDLQNYGQDETNQIVAAMTAAAAQGRNGQGLDMVYAAGNEGNEGADVSYDSVTSDPHAIAVAGINADGTPALRLTHGAGTLVSAPAVNVVTATRTTLTGATDANGLPAGTYGPITGTSFAAPGVSGVIALMLQANPGLGWRDVQEILVDAARIPGANAVTKPDGTPWFANNATGDWNGGGRHVSTAYGYGVPDADVAVQLAKTWTPFGTSANLVTGTVSANPALTITGGGPIATTSLTYTTDLRVEHVQVTLHAPQLQAPNLLITLIAPDGTRSTVSNQAGVDQSAPTLAAGPNDPAPIVDSEGNEQKNADGSIKVNTAPLNFTLNDAGFWGVDARGTWTLQVTDYKTGETGTLDNFGLTFLGDAPSAPQTLVYTPEFATMAAADPTRLQVRATASTATLDAAALSGQTTINLNGGAGMLGGVAVTVAGGIANAIGGRGDTTLIGTSGANRLTAGDGDTLMFGGGGADTLLGGNGHDVMLSGGSSLLVTGKAGTLVALADADTAFLQGSDTVVAGTGTALVGAFGDNAAVFGGTGNLEFLGGTGSSTVVGGAGSVAVFGGTGSNLIIGGQAGNNVIVAGTGTATIRGGGNNDLLFAQGSANQLIAAGSGNETIDGATGTGNNTLFAGSGNDLISTGAGQDTVFAGSGNATVIGGTGATTYAWVKATVARTTLITAFNQAKGDRLTLQGYDPNTAQQALATASKTAAGTTITLSDNTRITFAGLATLNASSFF